MNQPALSVQIYAVNDQLTEDLDGTLAYVRHGFALCRGLQLRRPGLQNSPRRSPATASQLELATRPSSPTSGAAATS